MKNGFDTAGVPTAGVKVELCSFKALMHLLPDNNLQIIGLPFLVDLGPYELNGSTLGYWRWGSCNSNKDSAAKRVVC